MIERTTTPAQEVAIFTAFVCQHMRGETIDDIQLKRAIREQWGLNIDWHPAASALENLARAGQATRTNNQIDGHYQYRIKQP
jgi:hypothetical protein